MIARASVPGSRTSIRGLAGGRRHEVDRAEEQQDRDRDPDQRQQVLAAPRRSAAAPSGPGPGWPAASLRRRSCRVAGRRVARGRADQGEIGVLERAADRARLGDEQPLGRGAPGSRSPRSAPGVGGTPAIAYQSASTTTVAPARGRRRQRRHLRPRSSGRSNRRRSRGCTPAAQLGGRARGDDPAVDQDRDPVGQPLDVGEVVARQEDRDAGRPAARRRSGGSRRGPPGPSRRSARRAAGPRVARRAPARGRAAAARRRTAAGSACPADVPEPDEVAAARRGRAGRRGTPRTGAGSRAAEPACRCRRPGASARPGPGAPRPPVAGSSAEDPDRSRRRPVDSPR